MATVLVVDDEIHLRTALGEILKAWGHNVILAENYAESLSFIDKPEVEVVLADVQLPDGSGIDLVKHAKEKGIAVPIVIMTGHASIEDAVTAIQLGAENYLTKPVEPPKLRLLLEHILEKQEMKEEVASLRKQLRKAGTVGALVGRAGSMQQLYTLIERVAITDASVFITGESGTGKTLIAKTVHEYSRRRKKPFVVVNCAAIAPTLIESELFGHEKGSFTGANAQRRGYFEEAYGGTIFLDEITELPIELQGKLLRVLEENKIRRVGGNQELEINVRLITATNRDPKLAISDGKLREDLYYRINIFPIHAPSLRERAEDVPFLAQMFLEKLCEEENQACAGFEPRVLDVLRAYEWPGNVRELRNVVNRALIISRNDRILVDCLPDYLRASVNMDTLPSGGSEAYGEGADDEGELAFARTGDPAAASMADAAGRARAAKPAPRDGAAGGVDPLSNLPDGDTTLEAMEKLMIKRLLGSYENNKPLVADKLGISLKTLYNKIKKYDL